MKPITYGFDDYGSRSVAIQYITDDKFDDLNIKDSCFLLTVVYEGELCFKIGENVLKATAPCLVCFDESISPELMTHRNAKCDSVYFHPSFLNVNMSFSLVHGVSYPEIATLHDMFLLKPFTDKDRYVFQLFEEHTGNVRKCLEGLKNALTCQSDWYWSCRGRSYFMEILLFLERLYGLNEQNDYASQLILRDPQLKKAVIYIENCYREKITLEDIAKAATINRSTLTKLFKAELGMSPVQYLWHHRVSVAKKFLEFTSLPIKEIALRCGFKTIQHFSRKFEKTYGESPSKFRTVSVTKRKSYF